MAVLGCLAGQSSALWSPYRMQRQPPTQPRLNRRRIMASATLKPGINLHTLPRIV
jgi:hypothetical protein